TDLILRGVDRHRADRTRFDVSDVGFLDARGGELGDHLLEGHAQRLELLLLQPEDCRVKFGTENHAEATLPGHTDGLRFGTGDLVEFMSLKWHARTSASTYAPVPIRGAGRPISHRQWYTRRGVWE